MAGSVSISGVGDWQAKVKAELKKLEKTAINEVAEAAFIVSEAFFDRTPVWEGTTIRNYRWGKAPVRGGQIGAIGSGDPGHTGFMSLGSEPRRPANENAVMAELRGVLPKDKLHDLYLTNTVRSEQWDLVDNGAAPRRSRARNPGGVTKIALANAKSRLKHFK